MPGKRRALIDDKTIPSGQRVPRDRIGDKKGYYPEPTRSNSRGKSIDLVSQCLRHGKQGVSSVNWDAFGAKGNKGRVRRDKRPMRLQNSPVPHVREHTNVRFDNRTGKMIRKDRYKPFSNK